MKKLLLALAVAVAGCANQPPVSPVLTPETLPNRDQTDARTRAELHTQLGAGYFEMRNFRVALEELQEALRTDPNYGPAHNMLALVYMELREDALALYGFLTERERSLFHLLLGVTGIGPRVALTVLSGIPPSELVDALRRQDVRRLVAVPGVGKKTAERMVLELAENPDIEIAKKLLESVEKSEWGGWVASDKEVRASLLRNIIDAGKAGKTASDIPPSVIKFRL